MSNRIQRMRQLGQAMMQPGMSGAPVQHWTQALGRVGQAYAGQKRVEQADEMEQQRRQKLAEALSGDVTSKELLAQPETMDYGMKLRMAELAQKPKLPTGMVMGQEGRPEYMPEYISGQERLAAAKRPEAPKISVSMGKGESKYFEERSKAEAKEMEQMKTAASSAYSQNKALDSFIDAAKKGYAGGAAPIKTAVTNFLASFGFESEALKSTQLMQQAVGQILSQKMAELGARGLTDKDMEILIKSLPKVETDPQARLEIANIVKRANDATIKAYKEGAEWEDKTYPSHKFRRPSWLTTWKQTEAQPTQQEAGQRTIRFEDLQRRPPSNIPGAL